MAKKIETAEIIEHKFWMTYTLEVTFICNESDNYEYIEVAVHDSFNLFSLIEEIESCYNNQNLTELSLEERAESNPLLAKYFSDVQPVDSLGLYYTPIGYKIFYYDDRRRKYKTKITEVKPSEIF